MAEQRCWNCGRMLRDTDAICGNCGVDLIAAVRADRKPETARAICAQCNASAPLLEMESVNGRLLCAACGLRLREQQAASEERKRKEREMLRQSGIRSRRKAERFEVAHCFVRVAPAGLTAKLLRQDKLRVGPLVDLSRTGLQCVAAGRFQKGDVIRVEILAPAFNRPLILRAYVRWAMSEGEGRTRMGVEFDDADPETQAHLKALEQHEALRNAAYLLEEKKKRSTAALPLEDLRREGIKDF
ncbi:MAG: PilZ domain-containing protein [Planctomycetota bacterium]|nr:PilZ domain-containing protein [Planctomycetota bacterium]